MAQQYKMVARTSIGGLPFEWNFEAPDHESALEFVGRHAVRMVGWRDFMGFDVWTPWPEGKAVGRDWQGVGFVSVNEPTAKIRPV